MGRTRLPAHLRALVEAQTTGRQEQRRQTPPQRPKRQRPAHWPPGVDSALEMALVTRLERAGLPLGVGQYRIVEGRQFTWDRAWPEQRVCAEVQGAVWTQGAHSRGSGVQRDCLKASLAAAYGWRCLPLTREMIEDGTAVRLIAQALGLEAQAS